MRVKTGVLMLTMLLLLAGCGRADLSSTVEFTNKSEPEKLIAEILPKLRMRVETLDGACITYLRGTSCRFLDRNASHATDIQIGVSDGKATIVIHTESAFLLPKSEAFMRQGDYIPTFHKQWEDWIVDEAEKIGPQTRTRYYTGLGVIGDF